MRRFLFLFLLSSLASVAQAQASQQNLKDTVYAIETDDESARDSLDRISGHIDTGFSSQDESYLSEDHYGVGPFAKQKSEEKE